MLTFNKVHLGPERAGVTNTGFVGRDFGLNQVKVVIPELTKLLNTDKSDGKI